MIEGIGRPERSELFRLKACPACEYSLETLPAEGTCPECGRWYDQRFIVLTGQGRGRWDGAAGGTWRGMVGQVVCVFAFLYLYRLGMGGVNGAQMVAWGAVGVFVLATQLYGRLFSAREPQMQLWLSPEGVGQVLSTPEGRRARWFADNATLLFLPVFVGALFFEGGRWIRVSYLPVAVVVVLCAGIVWARQRNARGSGEGADFVPGLWAWGAIERIQVVPLSGERFRVRCRATQRWRWIAVSKEWVIDIEVACPAKVAERLGRQMIEWCPKADATGA